MLRVVFWWVGGEGGWMAGRRWRIGIGGIAIESSTFSPHASTLDDFTILRGEELGARYPFMPGWRFAGRDDLEWLPCFYARSLPGGPVVASAYAAMRDELLERLRAVLPLDGLYLDLHGAMAVEGLDDAEAELAEAVRAVVGPECVISAGMDLHGNVSARLVAQVDLFTAHRLAPHEDAPLTRERACANLVRCLDGGLRLLRAWVPIPVILPGERTSTLVEPGKGIYAGLAAHDWTPGVIDASLWVGYVWADQPRSGACVVVTGTDAARMREVAAGIARRYWEARHDFGFSTPVGDADWCIAEALGRAERPVVISDSGDNPTAGGAGDTPVFVGHLLAHPELASGTRSAIFASIPDPAAVAACAAAGVGGEVAVALGGKLDRVHASPLAVRGRVESLHDGDPVGGRIAVLRVGGVAIIVTSRRKPYHHLRDFTELGLDPAASDIVAVKIGYLEPELRRLARGALLALTPGAVDQDIPRLPYRRVVRPVFPLDPGMPEPGFEARVFGG
jgi:microcystin degradation protein MlrC